MCLTSQTIDKERMRFMKKIMAYLITASLLMLMCLVHVSAEENTPDIIGNGKYEAVFVERLNLHYSDLGYSPSYGYEELYFHYGESEIADETEPEYALVMAHNGTVAFSITPYYWGDWVYFDFNSYPPGGVPYYIYVPAEDKIYTVEEAVNAGIKDIETALKKIEYCALLGDVDGNYILNIKDATEIQKFVAGLDSALSGTHYSELMNVVANFARDVSWTVNVKDATAIQKHIAGLEY